MGKGQPGTSSDPLVYEDMTLADLRIAVPYFISYGDGSVQDLDIRDISLRSKAWGSGSTVRATKDSEQKDLPLWPSQEITWYSWLPGDQ